jgi:hypothetical protein
MFFFILVLFLLITLFVFNFLNIKYNTNGITDGLWSIDRMIDRINLLESSRELKKITWLCH